MEELLTNLQPGDIVLRVYRPWSGWMQERRYYTLILCHDGSHYIGYNIRLTKGGSSVKLIGACWSDFVAEDIRAVWTSVRAREGIRLPILLSDVKDILRGYKDPVWKVVEKEDKDVSSKDA